MFSNFYDFWLAHARSRMSIGKRLAPATAHGVGAPEYCVAARDEDIIVRRDAHGGFDVSISDGAVVADPKRVNFGSFFSEKAIRRTCIDAGRHCPRLGCAPGAGCNHERYQKPYHAHPLS